jgi:hypothetical protein
MAGNEQLNFKTLDFELSRLEGSSILDEKVRQAARDAAYFVREMRNLARAGNDVDVTDILRRIEMRVNQPDAFKELLESEGQQA